MHANQPPGGESFCLLAPYLCTKPALRFVPLTRAMSLCSQNPPHRGSRVCSQVFHAPSRETLPAVRPLATGHFHRVFGNLASRNKVESGLWSSQKNKFMQKNAHRHARTHTHTHTRTHTHTHTHIVQSALTCAMVVRSMKMRYPASPHRSAHARTVTSGGGSSPAGTAMRVTSPTDSQKQPWISSCPAFHAVWLAAG